MSYIKSQLSLLVHLSKVDKHIAEPEAKMIHYIGERNGISYEEIEAIIDNPGDMPSISNLDPEMKFDYLYNIVQLMKIDGKVFQSEIDFCEKVALRLGYKPGVIADLSAYIYSDPNINTNKDYLRSIADGHLIPRKKK
ncbi:TerB family tellurite resistance protein [Reichenbachiella sp. MALMAid0571]|uniref:tellurite resistance TerB family protein n=1 Tax=Reichenbachiella sp. MALMAid0571 TaxID=3143939 RepID=UPI0032DEE448